MKIKTNTTRTIYKVGIISLFVCASILMLDLRSTQAATVTHTSQGDFESGTVPAQLDATTNPGSLQFSATLNSMTQTSDTDFNAGSYSDTVVSGTGDGASVNLDINPSTTTIGGNFARYPAVYDSNFGPLGMASDVARNKIYASDSYGNRILMMDSGTGGTTMGENLVSFGTAAQFGQPAHLYVDTTNNKVFITDRTNNRIAVVDSGGGGTTFGDNFATFGSVGFGSGQFSSPYGIHIDAANNKAYVVDNNNNRIVMMDSGTGGTTLGANFVSFGTYGATGDGRFNYPVGINIDTVHNKAYITNNVGDSMIMMDSGMGGTTFGANFARYGLSGAGFGRFNAPNDVFVDSANNKVYIADLLNTRLVTIDSGTGGTTFGNNFIEYPLLDEISTQPIYPYAFDVDMTNGKVFIADLDHDWIYRFDIGVTPATYKTPGTFDSGNIDMSASSYDSIAWDASVPAGTAATIQSRTVSSTSELDEFDSGDTSYITDLYNQGGTYSLAESGSILTMNNASGNDIYMNFDTGKPVGYYPAGTVITARVRLTTDSTGSYVYAYTDYFDEYEYLANTHDWMTISLVTTQPFTTAGINAYGFNNTNPSDKLEVDWIRIDTLGAWSAWSAPYSNSSGSAIENTNGGNLLQYRATLSTSDTSVTPSLNSVTLISAPQYASSATYISPIIDASEVADWQTLAATTSAPANTSITFQTRAGNTATPDVSWTSWGNLSSGNIISTDARYLQYKAIFLTTDTGVTPTLNSVAVTFSTGISLAPPTFVKSVPNITASQHFFDFPVGAAVDVSGNLYVLDYDGVRKLDSSGNELAVWNIVGSDTQQVQYASGIALDASGNIYISDGTNYVVNKYDSSGSYVSQITLTDNIDGAYSCADVVVDSLGNVYALEVRYDGVYSRIQKFDSNGVYVRQWGGQGAASNYQFTSQFAPHLAIDSTGNIYVVDWDTLSVKKYDSDGQYLGKTGSGIFGVDGVGGITIDSSGVLYAVGIGENLVYTFDTDVVDGTMDLITSWSANSFDNGGHSYDQDLAASSTGNLYLTDYNINEVKKFDLSGTVLGTWNSSGSGNGEFNYPNLMAVDQGGNLYVADGYNNRIQKLNSDGTYISQWGSGGSGNGQFEYPDGIAVDSSGNVYVSDKNNNRIQKFDSNGTYISQWGSQGSGNGQFESPGGIAIDSSNYVYIVDYNNNRIQKFDSSGTYISQWGSQGSGNGQFEYPNGIAIDPSNNVYVVDGGNNRIQKFDSNGTYISQWGSQGQLDGQFEYPSGIAIDSNDNVYVADTDNKRIQEFDSDGNYLTKWGSYGVENSHFLSASGIAVSPDSNTIYVSDNAANLLKIFLNQAGQALADAKTAAHSALTNALATYTESDYTPANWTILNAFKTDGDAAIDAATDIAGVTAAQNTATSGMDGVQTIAETLVAAKTAAHTALTNALASYTESDYTPANWTILTGFKTDGDSAIDAATDLAGVTAAQNAAVNGMDGVQTIAEQAALSDAKTAAHSALTNALASYTESDYTPANWTILNAFKTDGDAAIDAATDAAGVTAAQNTATSGMDGVQTIAEQGTPDPGVTAPPTPELVDVDDVDKDSVKLEIKVDPAYAGQPLDFVIKVRNEDNDETDENEETETPDAEGNVTITIDGLDSGTEYSFEVKVSQAGSATYSDYSNNEDAATNDDIEGSECKPQDLTVKIEANGDIKLTWREVCDDIDKIQIERKPNDGDFEKIASIDGDKKSYIDDGSKLSDGEYTYRIRGNNDDEYSEYSTKETITIQHEESGDGAATSNEPAGGGTTNYDDYGLSGNTNENTANTEEIAFQPQQTEINGNQIENSIEASNESSTKNQSEEDATSSIGSIVKKAAMATKQFAQDFSIELAGVVLTGVAAGTAVAASSSAIPLFPTSPQPFQGGMSRLIGIMGFTGRKKEENDWGVAFDSETKQPIQGATISLINEDGNVAATATSDSKGRFGFLPVSGKYIIRAEKGDYQNDETRSEDVLYGDVYTGQEITINENEVLKMNIAFSSTAIDWRDFAQRKIASYKSILSIVKKDFFIVIFYVGLIISTVNALLLPSPLNTVIFIIYIALLVYQIFFKKKGYGTVMQQSTGNPAPFAIVALYVPDQPTRRIAFAVSDVLGRYYLLAENGSYLMKVSGNFLGGSHFEKTVRVQVEDGIVRSDVKV